MQIKETALKGLYLVDTPESEDERGSFFRTWCGEHFEASGIATDWIQCSLSRNRKKGTLRGLHFQQPPSEEDKLVRCVRGAIYDVAVDLRPNSPTLGKWIATELTAQNRQAFYIPRGFAHGFQSLEDDSEVLYMISEAYQPDLAAGVRWSDPDLAIPWPIADPTLSERDQNLPTLAETLSKS